MNKNSREWFYEEFKDQNLYSGIVQTIIDNCFIYNYKKYTKKRNENLLLLLFRGVYIVIFLILESDALAWNAFDSVWSKAPM